MDHISKKHRSWNMGRIKSRNTKPEKTVRSMLHRLGYRFRVCRKDLPGKPDIVLPKFKTIILVNGCFWHRHKGCKDATIPKTRTEWWLEKLNRNVERDREVRNQLEQLGWNVVVLWACEVKESNLRSLKNRLQMEIHQ